MTTVNITQQLLKEYFEYHDGHLWWIKPTSRRVKIGQQFGTIVHGYRRCQLFNKVYSEHRLIWLYHYGEWPKDQLDHINGNPGDNRIENLREVTNQQNQFNKRSLVGSTSVYKGVCWHKRDKKWVAQAKIGDKCNFLGYYATEEEAAEAYRKATEHLHLEYANYG